MSYGKEYISLDNYIKLAIAITKQAAEDYAVEYNKYLRTGVRSTSLTELERWFKSPWGRLCSFKQGDVIIKYIQQGITIVGQTEYWDKFYDGIDIASFSRPIARNVNSRLILQRLAKGWSIEDAFCRPKGERRGKKENL